MALFRALDDAEVHHERRNIWDDPDAAVFVRSVARGHETVPTVVIGTKSFVNPAPAFVLEMAHAADFEANGAGFGG